MKINLPQHVLTVTNVLEYKINIVAKKLDILCFTSILCASFSIVDVSQVKDIFSRNKLIAKVCFAGSVSQMRNIFLSGQLRKYKTVLQFLN